jgi:hypothetical protein
MESMVRLSYRDTADLRVVTIPAATNYVHLDRPERGRTEFLSAVIERFGRSPLSTRGGGERR